MCPNYLSENRRETSLCTFSPSSVSKLILLTIWAFIRVWVIAWVWDVHSSWRWVWLCKKNRKGIFKKRWNLSPFLCTCMSHCLLCQDNCNGGKTDTLNVLGLCSGRPLLTRGGIVAGANVITLNICLGAGQPISFCVFVVSVLVRHPSTGVPYMRADWLPTGLVVSMHKNKPRFPLGARTWLRTTTNSTHGGEIRSQLLSSLNPERSASTVT